ncbi:MAG: site-2 protease family protein [Clostridia bacterium]|nr:site-2 protease family protein [Clostridia bacterium]
MTVFWSIIAAIFIFGFLILVHEAGHYFVARRCGVAIEEFSIGMGPKIISRTSKKNGTVFSLRALPIGGYVAMVGETEESDEEGALSSKPVWQRFLVFAAGATVNLLVGFLIVIVIVCISASQGVLASNTIAGFQEGATSSAQGGLMVGDEVIKVGGVSVHTGEELTYEITNQGDEPIDLTVIRDGEKIVLQDVCFPTFEESGVTFGNYDFYVLADKNPGFFKLLQISFYRSCSLVKMVWDSLLGLITGRFGVQTLSGPVGITAAVAETIESSGWSAMQILNYALYITAVIAINLGVFNLIPFPALDGGRLFFLLIEAVRRKKINPDIEAKINFVGIALLMTLMLFVVCKDIIGLF